MEAEMDIQWQSTLDSALNNPLIVQKICSFTSETDLRSFRLVNHLFHNKATRRHRAVQKKVIYLNSEIYMKEFLTLIQSRIEASEPNSFPFSAFKLNLENSLQTFQRFADEVGQHIRVLKFRSLNNRRDDEEGLFRFEEKVVSLLRRSPNLVEFKLHSSKLIYIKNCNLLALPGSFPCLRVIDIDTFGPQSEFRAPLDVPALMSIMLLLITLAKQLDTVKFVSMQEATMNNSVNKNPVLGAIRALLKHHQSHIPLLALRNLSVSPRMLPTIQELTSFNLPVERLHTDVVLFDETGNPPAPASTLLDTLSSLLKSMSSNLKILFLSFMYGPSFFEDLILQIPPLPELSEFKISFEETMVSNEEARVSRVLLDQNQFSVLRKLSLKALCLNPNTSITFEGILPSVQEFEIGCDSAILEASAWNQILPNLKSVRLHTDGNMDNQSLSYILEYFPGIFNLEFECYFLSNKEADLWDTMTGGAELPVSTNELLHGRLSSEENGKLNESFNGIHPVASFRNLEVLQTMDFKLSRRSNLNAIVYITRVGLLVPLEKLTLAVQQLNLKVEEKLAYREILAQFHTEVVFT